MPNGAPHPLSVDVFTADDSNFHVTSTLVSAGGRAVLVDAQLTLSHGRRLAQWIADKGVELSAILITHKHPDHYLGAPAVLERFPTAGIFATAAVARSIADSQGQYAGWTGMFGSDIAAAPALPEALETGSIDLGGHELRVVDLPQGDCGPTSFVHIPAIRTVVAGDLAYNGTHVGTADTDAAARRGWLESLDALSALEPETIVAGHRAPGGDDAAGPLLSFNRKYLADFDAALAASAGAEELQARMLQDYAGLALPVMLQFGAGSQFAGV